MGQLVEENHEMVGVEDTQLGQLRTVLDLEDDRSRGLWCTAISLVLAGLVALTLHPKRVAAENEAAAAIPL
jgi:hypothetical protein